MNKAEFLAELRAKLKGLPSAECDAALAYYDDYLFEAGPEQEAATIAELGSPAEVASTILSSYIIKDTKEHEKTAGKGLSNIWLVVAGVLASPIALPLAIVVIAVLFSLLVAVLSVVFSLFVSAAALVFSGVALLGFGLYALFTQFATGVFTIGSGLVCAAVGLALFLGTAWLTKISINGIALLGARTIKKRSA
jgi:uncharacterized membrane protein